MIRHLYNKHRQLALYGIIGATGATLDLLFYILFYQALHIPPFFASFLSVSVGIVNNFILNNRYNFKSKDHTLTRFVSFYIIGCFGAILSALLILFLFNLLHIDPTVSKILTIIPVVLLQYYVNKRVSFSDNPKHLQLRLLTLVKAYWIDAAVIGISAALFFLSIFYLPALDDIDNLLGGKLILEGQLPYRDFFSHHAPGMYFLSALLYPFASNDVFMFRLIFNAITFSLLVTLYILLRKYASRVIARVYIILISLAHTVAYAHLPLGESLIAMIVSIVIVLLYLKDRNSQQKTCQQFIISILLFLIPFLSLAYIFPALVLYAVHFIITISSVARHRLKLAATTLSIYATPYVVAGIGALSLGLIPDVKYDLLTFNSTYYAPMVGEQGGGILKTFIAMVSNTAEQISLVGKNILNTSYSVQAFLLFGIALFSIYLWRKHRKIEAISIPFLLLLLNTRSNIFNAPAISSSLDKLSQHASLYVGTALLLGSISTIYFLVKSNNKFIKVICTIYLIIIPFTLLNIWLIRSNSVFISKSAENYHSYAQTLKTTNVATVINQLSTKEDYAWIAPADFASQLYLMPQRASKYTFYMPWLDASPKIRDDLVHSLDKLNPKIVYFGSYGENKYSEQVTTYIDNNYFTVRDNRLKDYHFNKSDKDQLLKEIAQHGYQN